MSSQKSRNEDLFFKEEVMGILIHIRRRRGSFHFTRRSLGYNKGKSNMNESRHEKGGILSQIKKLEEKNSVPPRKEKPNKPRETDPRAAGKSYPQRGSKKEKGVYFSGEGYDFENKK